MRAAVTERPASPRPPAGRSQRAGQGSSRTGVHWSAASSARSQSEVSGTLVLELATAVLQLGVFSYPPAPRPSPRPSTDVKVQATLKECVGKRPYRIYMADPEKMDAFAYSIVNRDQVHVLQWNLTGIHSLKMSRATFAALPQRPFFLYMGRSTSGLLHCTARHCTMHAADMSSRCHASEKCVGRHDTRGAVCVCSLQRQSPTW